jgi:hypothetical protein
VSTHKFSLIDAFAKFAGLERVFRMIAILLSFAFIQPLFMRKLLNDLYLLKKNSNAERQNPFSTNQPTLSSTQ